MALHHKTDENLYRLNRGNYKSMHFTMMYYKKFSLHLIKNNVESQELKMITIFFFVESDLYMISEFKYSEIVSDIISSRPTSEPVIFRHLTSIVFHFIFGSIDKLLLQIILKMYIRES